MRVDEARTLLRLPGEDETMVTPQDVRTAFRRAVRRAHPDVGGDPAEAGETVHRLRQARELLLSTVNNECRQCRGEGWLAAAGRFKTYKKCEACNGSGEKDE